MYDLFLYAYKQQLFLINEFMYSVFGLAVEDNAYVKMIDSKNFNIIIDDKTFGPFETNAPALDFQEEITIPIHTTPIIKTDVSTSIGIAVVNQILIEYGLSNKYPFMPDGIDGKKLHKRIISDLQDDTSDITIEDYKRWSGEVVYIRNQAQLFIVSNTEKTISKPDWLDEYMKEVSTDFTNKYGEDWVSDNLRVLKYEKVIMDKYAEYLKDDPTWGVTTSGKVFAQSMKKRYISIGILDGVSGKSATVLNRLSDGYEKDATVLAGVFNNIVHGSHARGTQVITAGVTSKRLIEALHQYKINIDDCGSTKGFLVMITENNKEYVVGSYYIKDNFNIHITNKNIDSLIGKTIELRYPTYCVAEDGGFCKICMGDKVSKLKGGIPLIAIMTGGMGVSFFMSKFHATTRGLYRIGLSDLK